jgi:tetratricopeptide (TPR) repeat protein
MSESPKRARESETRPSTSAGRLQQLEGQSQLDFEIAFFDRLLAARPEYVEVLKVHGQNLATKGEHTRGLDVDVRLAQLRPHDPIVHYNLACSYAQLQMTDAAIESLDSSLRLGYRDFEHILGDPDLEHLRQDTRFLSLLVRYWVDSKKSDKSR